MSDSRTKPTASTLVTSKPSYDKKVDLFVYVEKMQEKGKGQDAIIKMWQENLSLRNGSTWRTKQSEKILMHMANYN